MNGHAPKPTTVLEFVGARSVEAGGDGGVGKADPATEHARRGAQGETSFALESVRKWGSVAPRPGAGLANLGNSCFLNATLQCLAHTPQAALSLLEFPLREGDGSAEASSRALRDVLGGMLTRSRAMAPRKLLSKLSEMGPFSRSRQEDAHEFLRALLDAASRGFGPRRVRGRSLDPVSAVFTGELASVLSCPACGFESKSVEAFSDLSLEPVVSVRRALGAFFATETLDADNTWTCSRCGRAVRATKTVSLETPPEVLVIHLKRYASASLRAKVQCHVAFDDRLRLRSLYVLRGLVVHDGTTARSGHYSAFVKDHKARWHVFDDDLVSRVRPRLVFQQQAYLLFYSRSEADSNTAKLKHASRSLNFNQLQADLVFHCKRRNRWRLTFVFKRSPAHRRPLLETGEKQLPDEDDDEHDNGSAEAPLWQGARLDRPWDDSDAVATSPQPLPSGTPRPRKRDFRYDYWDQALDQPRKLKKPKKKPA